MESHSIYRAEQELLADMAGQGIVIAGEVPFDGVLRRYRQQSDKPGKKSAWVQAFADDKGVNAVYGCWKTGIKMKWKQGGFAAPLTPQQRHELRQASAEAEANRIRRAQDARAKAQKLWDEAKPASPDHPYFKDKKIKPHGMRVGKWRKRVSKPGEKDDFITLENVLLIPMLGRKGELHGLQGITETGEKLFMSGTAKKGKFYPFGDEPLVDSAGKPVMVFAEGFATAASIHEATGHRVYCGFDLGNMLEVARQVHAVRGDTATLSRP